MAGYCPKITGSNTKPGLSECVLLSTPTLLEKSTDGLTAEIPYLFVQKN
jgi:hypothetical protein